VLEQKVVLLFQPGKAVNFNPFASVKLTFMRNVSDG
jgi:hypothetical protein